MKFDKFQCATSLKYSVLMVSSAIQLPTLCAGYEVLRDRSALFHRIEYLLPRNFHLDLCPDVD